MICVLIARLNRKHRIIFISVLTILSSFGANFNPTGTNFDIIKFSLGSVHYLSAAGMRGGGGLTNGKTQCKKVFVPLYHVGKLSLRNWGPEDLFLSVLFFGLSQTFRRSKRILTSD